MAKKSTTDVLEPEADADVISIEPPQFDETDEEATVEEEGPPVDEEWLFEVKEAIYAEPIPLDEKVFTPIGLVLGDDATVGDMGYLEWARIGGNIKRIVAGHQWWAGDWYNMGEDEWGDEIYQVLNEINGKTISNWALACRAWPMDERVEGVDFTHFKYLADLKSLPSRRKGLRLVQENKWTTAETLAYVKQMNGNKKEDKNNDDDKERGATSSYTFTGGFRLAPADVEYGDQIAAAAIEAIESECRRLNVDPLGVNAFNRSANES